MEALWQDFSTRHNQGSLDKEERKFFKKLVKALGYLSEKPKHNSLAFHEIADRSRKQSIKIFLCYLEKNTPGAGRIFWTYITLTKSDITIFAIEPHPEDKKRGAYELIKLSKLKPSKGGKGGTK